MAQQQNLQAFMEILLRIEEILHHANPKNNTIQNLFSGGIKPPPSNQQHLTGKWFQNLQATEESRYTKLLLMILKDDDKHTSSEVVALRGKKNQRNVLPQMVKE